MNRTSEYYFSAPVATKMFSEDGKRLMVLLNDQTLFQMDISGGSEAIANK